MLTDLLGCLRSLLRNISNVSALNFDADMVTSISISLLTAPKRATDFRIGAFSTIGSLSSAGTHIRHRVPCCWKWNSSKLYRSIPSSLAKRLRFFISLFRFWIRVCNKRPRFAKAKTHLSENALALTHTHFHPVLLRKVMREQFSVPEILPIAKLFRTLVQIILQLIPGLFFQSPRSSRSFLLGQPCKSAIVKTSYPAMHSPRVLPDKPCNLPATKALADQQHTVETVVIAGFIGPHDFLPNGNSHDLLVHNLQLAHGFPIQLKVWGILSQIEAGMSRDKCGIIYDGLYNKLLLDKPPPGASIANTCVNVLTLTGFTYRGLSPHKFTPVPGVYKSLERTCYIARHLEDLSKANVIAIKLVLVQPTARP